MVWMDFLVGVISQWHENWPVVLSEMAVNLLKFPYSSMVREVEK